MSPALLMYPHAHALRSCPGLGGDGPSGADPVRGNGQPNAALQDRADADADSVPSVLPHTLHIPMLWTRAALGTLGGQRLASSSEGACRRPRQLSG